MVGIELHDVPEEGPAADLDHRLGPDVGFLRESAAETAGQYHRLHESPLPVERRIERTIRLVASESQRTGAVTRQLELSRILRI